MNIVLKQNPKNGDLVPQNPISGELVTDPVEESISPDELESYVKNIEENNIQTSLLFIFNDNVFETNSAIVRYRGYWLFWHGYDLEVMDWDWQEDMDELIKENSDEMDNHHFNSGWKSYTDGTWDFFDVDCDPEDDSFKPFTRLMDEFISKNAQEKLS